MYSKFETFGILYFESAWYVNFWFGICEKFGLFLLEGLVKTLNQLCPTQMAYWAKNYCHYLNQGRTLNNILMRAAHWMTYSDLRKLNLAKANVLKSFEY